MIDPLLGVIYVASVLGAYIVGILVGYRVRLKEEVGS